MIEKLKKRVIIASMIIVTLLLMAAYSVINIYLSNMSDKQADEILNELSVIYNYNPEEHPDAVDGDSIGDSSGINVDYSIEGDKLIVKPPQRGTAAENIQDTSETEEYSVSQEESTEFIPPEKQLTDEQNSDLLGRPSPFLGVILQEINANQILSAVYFTVVIDNQGRIHNIDTARISDVSEQTAGEYGLEVFASKRNSGWYRNYKYITAHDPDGNNVYVFLDREFDNVYLHNTAVVSGLVLLLSWGFMLLIVLLLTNRLVKPVADNIEKQKRFITDAGHEIKTPLAIIQANTEALEMFNGENKWTNNIKNQTVRLSNLLSNMLTLAKAEEGGGNVIVSNINISSIIDEYVNMFIDSAAHKGIIINNETAENLTVKGNKNQIGQVFSILLDNAVKYSDENSEIFVTSSEKDKTISFDVSSKPKMMPDCPPSMLFERFYRPGSSRYLETGNGIGLSSAKALTEQYGGSISCVYTDDDRISFTVTLKK